MDCSNCEEDKYIVNKYFKLCLECNNIRLYGNKYGKKPKIAIYSGRGRSKSFFSVDNIKKKGVKSLFAPTIKKVVKTTFDDDEEFYEKCFNNSNHKCEECGEKLPEQFRDINNKVIARWRYSHIIAKSIANKLRHKLKNINHLCMDCHREWDFGDKKSMKIYIVNKKNFPQYLD